MEIRMVPGTLSGGPWGSHIPYPCSSGAAVASGACSGGALGSVSITGHGAYTFQGSQCHEGQKNPGLKETKEVPRGGVCFLIRA